MIYVLYHAKCYDGFGSAYSAWKKLKDTAIYIPVSYGDAIPEMPDAEHIYIVDFTYPPEVLQDLAKTSKITVLDHHKTAQEALEPLIGTDPNLEIVFDMNRSGALITWEYFHGEGTAPRLIQHISDRDLWKFELPGTKELHSALTANPMTFELYDKLATDNFELNELIISGQAQLKMKSQQVQNIIENSWIGKIDDYEVPMVNTSIGWSEVGNELCKKYPNHKFAASFTVFQGNVMWSLRSIGEFDVSAVAKKFGGGGHKNAAGFKTTRF